MMTMENLNSGRLNDVLNMKKILSWFLEKNYEKIEEYGLLGGKATMEKDMV